MKWPTKTSAASGAAHEHTVLVVDDSDDTRESLALLLEVKGYRVAAVPSALEALHLMATLGWRPCIIIVDLIMPKMDGLTFRAELAKYPDLAAIPAVAVTGHEGLRRQALEAGFAAGLLKPCNLDELFALIDGHCGDTAPSGRTQRA